MAPGYETNDEARVPLIMKLEKSLYGLRQSPKNWFGTMDVELPVIDFRRLKSDYCVYLYEDETGFVILTLYMDGILLLSASKSLLNKFKKQLNNWFELSDMSDVSITLGINITRHCKNVATTISQKGYTEDVVQRFGMEGCNPRTPPE